MPEEAVVNGVTVVPKIGTAIGSVTEAIPKRRMGRAGKLEIVLDYVRLVDNEKAPVRAVKDQKGGSHVAGMTVGIVATGSSSFPQHLCFYCCTEKTQQFLREPKSRLT